MTGARLLFGLSVMAVLAWPLSRPAAAQQHVSDGATVALRFGWAPGTTAWVHVTRTRERVGPGSGAAAGAMRYRRTVHSHPEGLLISYDSIALLDWDAGVLTVDAAAALAATVLDLIVDRNGALLRLGDADAVYARGLPFLDAIGTTDSATAAASPEHRAALAAALPLDVLQQLAEQEWNTYVGMWLDAELELGVYYERDDELSVPVLQGAAMPAFTQFAVQGFVPCRELDALRRDCVEIELYTLPDPAAFAAAVQTFLRQFGAELDGAALESMEMAVHLVLVTEPTTLRPHRSKLSRWVHVTVRDGEDVAEFEQTDTTTYRYTYRRD